MTGEAGCSHKCHYSAAEDQFRCVCPERMELDKDAMTCIEVTGGKPRDGRVASSRVRPITVHINVEYLGRWGEVTERETIRFHNRKHHETCFMLSFQGNSVIFFC